MRAMSFDCRDYPIAGFPTLTHVGVLDGEAEVTFDTHTHLGFEVHVVRRGRASIATLPGHPPIEVCPDDVLFMPPGVPHRFEMHEPGARILWFGFQAARRIGIAPTHMLRPHLVRRAGSSTPRVTYTDLDGAHQALDAARPALPGEPLTLITAAPEISATAAQIVSEALEARSHADTRVLGLLLSLVAQVQRRIESPRHCDAGGSPVARALRYIAARSGERLSLVEVAAAVGVSEAHLSRAFHAATGRTFRHYVSQGRLAHARHLLSLGHRTVDVAGALGYASASTFCRWFHSAAGVPPGAFHRSSHPEQRADSAHQNMHS